MASAEETSTSHHAHFQNGNPSAHHDLSTEGDVPRLILDFRAARILLEAVYMMPVDGNDVAVETSAETAIVATESTQQLFTDAAVAPTSTDLIFFEDETFDDAPIRTSVNSVVSATFVTPSGDVAPSDADNAPHDSDVESKIFLLPFKIFTNDGSEGEAASDIYTDHNVGATPKSDFQVRLEKVSKTKLSGFANSVLSFLPQTGVGHILRNQEHDVGPSTSSNETTSSAPEANNPDGLSFEKSMAIALDDEEEDLILLDFAPSQNIVQPNPQAPINASTTIETIQPPSLLDTVPGSETTSVVDITNNTEVDIAHVAAVAATVVAALVLASAVVSASDTGIEDTTKCAKCGKGCGNHLLKCPCGHEYCSQCLDRLIEVSIRGRAPFPPACCDLPLPVDANNPNLDPMVLQEFFTKKFEVDCKTPTKNDSKFCSVITPPTDKSFNDQEHEVFGSSPHHEEEKRCHLCERVVAKGASKS
ncbi:hypothetical protein FAVG1_03064 [Fusarium avenaceum]|nr:hypothetical protein FAVG1_03064 [Fusarium avenaceum]